MNYATISVKPEYALLQPQEKSMAAKHFFLGMLTSIVLIGAVHVLVPSSYLPAGVGQHVQRNRELIQGERRGLDGGEYDSFYSRPSPTVAAPTNRVGTASGPSGNDEYSSTPWSAAPAPTVAAPTAAPWSSDGPAETTVGKAPIAADCSLHQRIHFCGLTGGEPVNHPSHRPRLFRCWYPNGNSGNPANVHYKLQPENAWIYTDSGVYPHWTDDTVGGWYVSTKNSNYCTVPP